MINRPLRSPVLHVWSKDAAIDRSDPIKAGAAYNKFHETGKLEDLTLIPGARPTVFELAPLTRKQLIACGAAPNPAMSDVEAVAWSLRSVRDFTVQGRALLVEHTDIPGIGKRVNEDVLDHLYDIGLFTELATRVERISRLDP